MTDEHIGDLTALTAAWRESSDQRSCQTDAGWREFFERLERATLEQGRGKPISVPTRNQVLLDAHGRCMFEGCGADLTEDPITHERGNFAALAHNVASSERGTRGVLHLSGALADDPDNILLLCDTHHRLVDTIAKADYPASVLSAMRRRYCETATELLDGLALEPMPAFGVAWPAHRQRISLPSSRQAAHALKPLGARLDGRLQTVNDNELLLRGLEGEDLWAAMETAVERTAEEILKQAHRERYRAALFAMGLMPALIALGAKLGNKCEITPMLRYRESGLWYWPANGPRGEFYTIKGLDMLTDSEDEVSLLLGLTDVPEAMRSTAESIGKSVVSVVARRDCRGNGALGHPDDGTAFRQRIQELLHRLGDAHGVRRVHVLPCASNAACVFFGQAFDSYHPELVVYDFSEGHPMAPRLLILNVSNEPMVFPASGGSSPGVARSSARPPSGPRPSPPA